MLWCSMLGVQCTKEHHAGARHYMHSLSSHLQVSEIGGRTDLDNTTGSRRELQ